MKKRLFIALPIPAEIRSEIFNAVRALHPEYRTTRVAWVRPENYHCTVHFLGDVEEELIPEIQKDIDLAKGSLPVPVFTVESRLGAFPVLERPQIVYVPLRMETPGLEEFQSKLGALLMAQGIEIPMRPWDTHVTVFRFKEFEDMPRTPFRVPGTSFAVPTVDLVESAPAERGYRYTVLSSHTFHGA